MTLSSKTPKKKKIKIADDLCREIVRNRGFCEAAGLDNVRCGGVLQWCHIIGRANKRIRWETYNALCMCQGHHVYYTHRPHEWFLDFIPKNFPVQFEQIQMYRNEKWDGDIDKIIERLEKEKENSSSPIDIY